MADNILNFNVNFNCNLNVLNVITNKFEALFEKCNIGAHIVKDSTVNMGNSVGKVADNMDDFADKVDFTVADVSDKFKDLDDIVDQFADDTEKVAEKSNGFKGAFNKLSKLQDSRSKPWQPSPKQPAAASPPPPPSSPSP